MNADRIAEIRAEIAARDARIIAMWQDGKHARAIADAVGGITIETVRGVISRHRRAA